MGYHFVCGASHQAISEGTKCRLVVLKQGAGYHELQIGKRDGSSVLVSQISNSCTSPTSYWEPQSAFLRATYEGYGRFELECTTASAAALLSLVKSIQYPLVTQAGDHHRDYGFDLERFLGSECPGFNAARRQQRLPADLLPLLGEIEVLWAYLSNAVTYNRAFVWCHISRQVRQLAFFPVHELAYQGLIDFTMQFVDYGQHDYAPESFVARVLAKVRDDASGRLSRRPGDADPHISQWAEDYFFDDSVFQAICESGRLDSSGIRAIRWLCTEGTKREALRGDLPLEKQVESLWPLLEQIYAHIAIDRLNITFAPHRTSVSDEGVEPGCQYAKFVMATSVHVQAEEFVRVFGAYQVFQATFDSHEQALTFAGKAPLLDVAIKDVLVVSSLLAGKLSIRFAMTADLDDARGLLASQVSQASAESLRLVS